MIKIQEHLNRVDAEVYLDSLADEHWNKLNPIKKKKKGYHNKSLVELCKKYLRKTKSKEYIKEFANNDVTVAARQRDLFSFLINNKSIKLKELIISRPTQYSSIKKEIESIVLPSDLYIGNPGKYVQTSFGKLLLEKIFNYSSFRGSRNCMDLLKKIGFISITCELTSNVV